MTASSVAGAMRDYVDSLGGPKVESAGDPQFTVTIPPPPEAADAVIKRLSDFAGTVAAATNTRYSGLRELASGAGRRDGIYSVPGRGGQSGGLLRPPHVAGQVEVGMLAMANARAIADLVRAEFDLATSVFGVSAEARVGQRRRYLHAVQLGLMGLILIFATAVFMGIGSRLRYWSTGVASEATDASRSLATPGQYLFLATGLIVVLGITAGFFRANRERALEKTDSPEHRQTHEAIAERTAADPIVRRMWPLSLLLSALIAGLVGIGGFLGADSLSIGRSLLGVGAWLLWGAVAFVGTALLTQLSQHWLNPVPVEIDLTDADRVHAAENSRSGRVGDAYINHVLRNQHLFVIGASVALVERYYEANLIARISSRDHDLDRFALEDMAAARRELEAFAAELPDGPGPTA